MASAIEKVLEIAATNAFDNDSVQTCLDAVKDLSDNIDLLIGSAPAHLDTIKELADALDNSGNLATNLIAKIDAIDVKASSGGGGLDTRPQWNLTQTISYSNTPSDYPGQNVAEDFGYGGSEQNNLGEGAVALNGNYLAINKCRDGNTLWVLKRENSTSPFKLFHYASSSHSDNNKHTKNSLKIDGDGVVYAALPGDNNNRGLIRVLDMDANVPGQTHVLKPSAITNSISDLSGNSYFGEGLCIAGDYLFVTAHGNKTMGDNTGSIFIYKRYASGDFKDASGNDNARGYKIVHGTLDTNVEPLKLINLGKNGLIAAEGDYFVTTAGYYPTEGAGARNAAVLFKKDANDDWNRECYLDVGYGTTGTLYNLPGDLAIKNSQVIATGGGGQGLNIFNLSGERTQYFDTSITLLRRQIIMFVSDDYLITGYPPSTNEYSPTIYKYSDPSWNKIDYLNDILPINLTQSSTASRYAQYAAAYHNNEILFGQTCVDRNGTNSTFAYGAVYYFKLSNTSVGNVSTDMEVPKIITKSIMFMDDEIPLQNKDGTKLSASKLINIDDDISCNTITKAVYEFEPQLLYTQPNTATGYNSLTNTKGESIKLYKEYAIFGFEEANWHYQINNSGTYYGGQYGAVILMKKNGLKWVTHQTLTPFLGSSSFNDSNYSGSNRPSWHNGDFGRAVDMNDNYIVVGATGGDKGGIRIFKKNSDGFFIPLNHNHFNYGSGTTTSSLVLGSESSYNLMKGYGENVTWTWRGNNNAYKHAVVNTMAITEDNLIIVSESNGTTSDIHLFVFYIDKSKPVTDPVSGISEPGKWDLIRIDTSDLETNTQRIGKIIHYGNSIVFCSSNGFTNDNNSFLYRYSYTVDSNGKPTFTYEQTFIEWGGVGFALTQNDDFVFLANPYYNNNHSQLHIYEKSTDESLSLLHTFTYNSSMRGIQIAATNKRLYLTTSDDELLVYKYDSNYTQSNNVVYWKYESSNDNYNFNIGQSSADRMRQYNYFQTNGVDLIVGQYNQKPKIYTLGFPFLKDSGSNIILQLEKEPNDPDKLLINLGNSKAQSLNLEEITTNKITLNNATLELAADNKIDVSKDIRSNKFLGDTNGNVVTTKTLNTDKIKKDDSGDILTKRSNIYNVPSHSYANKDNVEYGSFGMTTVKTSDGKDWFISNRLGFDSAAWNRLLIRDISYGIVNYGHTSDTNGQSYFVGPSIYSNPPASATNTNTQRYGNYGFSFAAFGDYIAISAPSWQTQAEGEKNGKIFIYKYDNTQANNQDIWKQSQVQVIDPPHTGHYNDSTDLNKGFGAMMEMDDKHLIVSFQNGSQANPPDDTLRYGLVFIYEKTGTGNSTFEYKQTLKDSLGGGTKYFGYNISLSGNYLVVGSPYADPISASNSGAIYVYKKVNDVWKQIQKITNHSHETRTNRQIGNVVNLYGDYLFTTGNGIVFVYKKNNDVFEEIHRLDDGGAQYGNTSANAYTDTAYPRQAYNILYHEKANLLFISNPRDNTTYTNGGKVTVYKNFVKIQELTGFNVEHEYFGQSLAIGHSQIFVSSRITDPGTDWGTSGGPQDYNNSGSVFNYSFDEVNDIIFNNDISVNEISSKKAVFDSLFLDGKDVLLEHVIKDTSGNLTEKQINTNKLVLSRGNLMFNRQDMGIIQERIYGEEYMINTTASNNFGAKIRINGDYMFVTEYVQANYIRLEEGGTLSNGGNFPDKNTYIIRIFKKNSEGIFEKYSGAPNEGRIEGFYDSANSSREFADLGDVQSVGDYLAVGAPQWNNGVSTSMITGRVYLFKNVAGVWKNDYITVGTSEYVDIPETSYPHNNSSDDNYAREFGSRITMNKDYLVVSREVDPSGGRVFIYKRNDNNKYQYVMDLSDNAYIENIYAGASSSNMTAAKVFGSYISMNEEYLLVSNINGRHNTVNAGSGYVSIYKIVNNSFVFQKRLFPDYIDSTSNSRFGVNHIVTDNYIFVSQGYKRLDDGTGYKNYSLINIYKKNSSDSWEFLKRVIVPMGQAVQDAFRIYNNNLGNSIASNSLQRVQTKMSYKNNKLYIGLPGIKSKDNTKTYVGGAIVLRNDNDQWNIIKTLYSPIQTSQYEHFGRAIDVDDDGNIYISAQHVEESWENNIRANSGIIYRYSDKLPEITVENNEKLKISGDIKANSTEFTDIKLSGKSIKKIYARETATNTEQVYYENFSDEDLTLHADSEANYKEGYFVDSKALNTIERTPEGLQWVQDLPSGSKSLSFWLKIPDQTGDKIILDTRDSNGKGFITIFYKNDKMYISANGDTSKYPAKILVDNTAVSIGSEVYKMKQLGTGAYLKDNIWHHWFIELAEEDNTKKITWFSRNTSGILIEHPEEWSEKQIYHGPVEYDYMGNSRNTEADPLAVHGDYIIIGNYRDDTLDENDSVVASESGIVRILKKENNTWSKIKDISSNPTNLANRRFGWSVSIYGDYAVVGDNYDDETASNSGTVYIYKKDEGGTDNWGQIKKLNASDGGESDNFGIRVKLYGDYLIASSPSDDDDGTNAGAVYVFKKDEGGTDNWGQIKKLKTGSGSSPFNLGEYSLDMNDNYIIAGTRDSYHKVFVFKKNEGGSDNWGQVKVLTGSEVESDDKYGESGIAIDGDYIVVGARLAHHTTQDRGKAYVYKNNNDSWDEIKILKYDNAANYDRFGWTVSIKNNIIAVGSPESDSPTNSGVVVLYQKDTGGIDNWGQMKVLKASDAEQNDYFGNSLAFDEGIIVVGAGEADTPGTNTGSGALYIFENSTFTTTSFFNIEARISEYRIFNTSLATEQITDLYNGNDGNFKNETISIDNNVSTKKLFTNKITLDGVDLTKIVQKDSSTNHSGQIYHENFDAEDVTIHADSEMTYVTGRDGTGKALNTTGVTPDGLQWVQTLPANSKSFSFWLKIPEQTVPVDSLFDKYIFDGRDSGNNGYLTAFYKNNKMYILPTDNNKNKFPSKILIDGVAATISSDWTDDVGRQVGTGKYLQDNKWHHWLIELSDSDSISELTWFSRFEIADNENGAAWNEIKKCVHSEGSTSNFAQFGKSVAIDGDYMIAGAPSKYVGTKQNVGAVWIFKKDEGGSNNWGEFKKLLHSDAPASNASGSNSGYTHHAGHSADINGDYIVVGAYGVNSFRGAAYIFKKDEGGTDNWGEIKKLTIDDLPSHSYFGKSVAIEGDYIVVGAEGNAGGKAYVFNKDEDGSDNWGLIKELTSDDIATSDDFGASVDINGNNILIGAYEDSHSSLSTPGSAYLFKKDYDPLTPNDISANAWGQFKKIIASDASQGSYFGKSVSIDGDYIVIGAERDDEKAANSGGAYIFKKDHGGTDNWGEFKKISASDGAGSDYFGCSVFINGDYIAVGADNDDDGASNAGSVYIFRKDLGGSDNWGQNVKLTASSPNVQDKFGRSVTINNNYLVVGAESYRGIEGNTSQYTGAAFVYRNDTFDRTTFFNLEAAIDDYRIFNKRLTNAEISDLAAGGNANVLGDAIVMDRIDVNDISCAALTVNGVSITQNGGGGGGTTLSVDTISESTTNNGVVIDSVTLKDGTVTTSGDISANDASFNVVEVGSLKVNGVSITQNGSGGASLNVNSDISINAIDAQDASFNVLRTSGTMAMGGHIIPTANAQYDLGNAEYKIRHLFLSDNSLWIGDQHKIDVDSGKIRFKKRKTGTGFVPKEILDASANSTATQHIDGVIAEFDDVTSVDDIKLHHWEAWVADIAKSGVTGLLPHQLFLNDDNFDENDEFGTAIKLPVKEDAGAPSTTPAVGTMTYNSSDGKLYIYNGSAWKSFSPDA